MDVLSQYVNQIRQLCLKHSVSELFVFGSILCDSFSEDSDIDFLVDVGAYTSPWFPAGLILDLEEFLGTKVDVVTEKGLNPLIRDTVLEEAVQI